MPDVHARLSASGAKRWMHCPKSVAIEEKIPEKDTPYSEEGTQAHALGERLIRLAMDEAARTGKPYRHEFTDEEWGDVPSDMKSAVKEYLEYVFGLYDSLLMKHGESTLLIEQRVDFSNWVPHGFGTSDCVIASGDELHVIDYKHGRGVKVECKGNPQPRLYALGAYELLSWEHEFSKIVTHIVQPRIGWTDTEELDPNKLLEWGEKEVKPAAELAWNDKGFFAVGEWCRFCKARPVCNKRAQDAIQALIDLNEEMARKSKEAKHV